MKNLADAIREITVLQDRLERVTKAAESYVKFWTGPPTSATTEARNDLKRALLESWALGCGSPDGINHKFTVGFGG